MTSASPSKDEDRQPRRRGRPPTLDRDAALDATRTVIAQRGLDRTRYADIAEESGVAVSTLQHAFGRLDSILQLALERTHQRDDAFLAALPAAGEADPWTRIETLVLGALAGESPEDSERASPETVNGWLVWAELWRSAARSPDTSARVQRAYERWWTAAERIIADGQADGTFTTSATPRMLSKAINAVLDGAAVSLLMRHDGGAPTEARDIALLAVRRLLGADPREGGAPATDASA
ncbi:MAG: TetR family transcriptional regulator C-terminal domain-containing protein [Patulibacter minatonensis]